MIERVVTRGYDEGRQKSDIYICIYIHTLGIVEGICDGLLVRQDISCTHTCTYTHTHQVLSGVIRCYQGYQGYSYIPISCNKFLENNKSL